MSLVTQLNAVLTRIATEFKAHLAIMGQLSNLTTADKTNLVAAINEAAASGGGGGSTNLTISRNGVQVVVNSDTGTDATIPAADGTNAGVMTSTMQLKLAGIETGAEVTSTAKVDAAGAVMVSDTSTAGMGFVVDEDDMASNSATKVPTQQSVKAYADALVAALVDSAPETLNELSELAAAIGNDPNFATTLAAEMGVRLRFDTAQSLTGTQQTQGQSNLSVYSRAQIGDPETDFVAVFEAGLV